jgi:prepilin-type N-terminal cleavage/methylation domain-containing protein
MKNTPTSQRGFSLIELLIVVAIIGIIASIAIPYLEQARQATKSASAVNSMRTINSAQASYRSANGHYGSLAELGSANYIADPSLRGGEKSGYSFSVANADTLNYEAFANPVLDPLNIFQHYYIDASGVIRVEVGAAATATSNALAQ